MPLRMIDIDGDDGHAGDRLVQEWLADLQDQDAQKALAGCQPASYCVPMKSHWTARGFGSQAHTARPSSAHSAQL